MLKLFLLLIPSVFSKSIPPSDGNKESLCSFTTEGYSLSWAYDDLSSDVVFKLYTKSSLKNFWTGVLLGDEKPTDAIGVFVRSGQIGLTDAHVSEDGILADNLTDVQSLSFDLTEDKLTAEFARPLTPQDKTDTDLARCVTFFFPVLPAEIDMGSPIEVPSRLEKKRVCDIIDSCVQHGETSLVKREEAPVCEYKHGQQQVKWRHEEGKYVFVFDHPVKKGKWWSSIGAGESMQEMTMAVAFAENGKIKSVGGYSSMGYQLPDKDETNSHDVTLINSFVKNARATYEFSINENFVVEKAVDGCLTLHIAINAGKYGNNFKINKHESLPTAIPICGMDKCHEENNEEVKKKESVVDVKPDEKDDNPLNEDRSEEETVVDVQPQVPGESVVDVKPAENTVVDVKPGIPLESIVDIQSTNQNQQPETVVDVNAQQNEESTMKTVDQKQPEIVPEESTVHASQAAPGEQIVDTHSLVPGQSIVDIQNQTLENGRVVDVHLPEQANETIIDFREVTNKAEDTDLIVDFHDKRAEENDQLANGTATIGEDDSLKDIIKTAQKKHKTTKKPKKMSPKPKGKKKQTVAPMDSIVDFKDETEGSGEIEGSGESVNTTNLEENADQEENSILTDLGSDNSTEHRSPIVNVDGVVDPKTTTFSPPVSIPKLHETGERTTQISAANQPTTSNVTISPPQGTTSVPLATVPKVCSNPQDLRICDGYFADYLAKVQEWSTKHNHTFEQSMFRACRLLGQVKYVPNMCCNRFKKECDAFSRQV